MTDWASAVGLDEPLALFCAALRIRAAIQRTLFRDSMEALAGLAPVLRRWDLNGSQTYGLAALATAWERRTSIPGLQDARHRAGASVDAEFRDDILGGELSRDADALFFLLDRPYPHGRDDESQRRLRAWALLRAADLAISYSAADANLARVCKALAQAADESVDRTWCNFLHPLGAPADRFEDINWRLMLAPDAQTARWPDLFAHEQNDDEASPGHKRTPKQRFLDAARRLARGDDPRPLNERTSADDAAPVLSLSAFGRSNRDCQLFPLRDELSAYDGDLPASVRSNEQADGTRMDVIDVDPFDTTAEQDAYVRSVRFQLGAAARFLPWAWHQLHPPEVDALRRLISNTLAEPSDSTHRLLAAITSLALTAGMGLDQAAQLPIGNELSADGDWRLDLGRGRLLRRPPRHERPGSLTDTQRSALVPAAEALSIPIDQRVCDALKLAQDLAPAAMLVSHLWKDRGRRSTFLTWLKADATLARLQPSMLAHHAGQATFQATGDHVLARLVSSNRSDALPASTVYAAFSAAQLAPAYPGLNTIPGSLMPMNVAGSRLDVISPGGLQPGFAHFLDCVHKARRTSNWVSFHNCVVLLWDAALRAATGVRPVTRLWPSLAAFDWELAAVYIDDKESPISHNGRLVPLPRQLCANFKRLYVDAHLPWVIARIGERHAPSKSAPPGLLFTIQEEYDGFTLKALENSSRRLQGGGVEAPLPLNYLRHRLRTELHRQPDADIEIVDAVLGHGDGGSTRTHGDFSMRCWIDDAEAIRPALARLFDDVGFDAPPIWDDSKPFEASSPLPAWLLSHQVQSRDKVVHEQTAALGAIRQFLADESLAGRLVVSDQEPEKGDAGLTPRYDDRLLSNLSSLSEEQLDRLARSLKSSDAGMPSGTGDLRLQALLELAGEAWDRLGRRVRLRRHHSSRQVEASPFTDKSPGAIGARVRLLEALDGAFHGIREHSRLTLAEALGLAACDLLLVSRIANVNMIRDIVLTDERWRIVRLGNSFFLEWSPSDDLDAKPEAAIQRFAISRRCAWLLNRRIRGKGRRQTAWATTNVFRGLPMAVGQLPLTDAAPDSDRALSAIALIVDQANAIELPGSVAAYLSQRLQTASLPWGDWIRLHHSRWHAVRKSAQSAVSRENGTERRQRLDALPEDVEEEFELVAQTSYARSMELGTKAARRTNDRASAGHELVTKVRDLIAGIASHGAGRIHRGEVADRIADAVKGSAGEVSSAIQLLCLWAIDLLLRPGRSRKLATRSVLRYFGALSPRFTAMGYEVELDRLEDDDIEAFYRDVLDGAKVQGLSDIHDALRNFHMFASISAGVAEIDWATIVVTDRIELGSPGFVDEQTYLQLLERLDAAARARGLIAWQLQCFAVLGYRFGLRGGEIEGLRRGDLVHPGSDMRVIVRNNRLRTLKTRSGKRVVPQLFELTKLELDALARLSDYHSVDAIGLENPPLFSSPETPEKSVDGPRLRAVINDELKAITGQPHSSMHKLRKSFAISLWMILEAPNVRLAGLQRIEGGSRTALVARLLGTPEVGITRRSGFAVATTLGHAHPSTALRSYLPVLSEVTASMVCVGAPRAQLNLDTEDVGLLALEQSLLAHIVVPAGQANPAKQPSALDMLRALLFVSQGRSPSTAALRLDLPLEAVDGLATDARAIFEKLVAGDAARLRQHSEAPRSRRLAPQGLLSLVHIRAHERLRRGLGLVATDELASLEDLEGVSSDHLAAMVGGRRQISMWEESHFRLTAFVARRLVQDRRRLTLEAPSKLHANQRLARVTQLAVDAGWLPAASSESSDVLCTSLVAAKNLPRVELAEAGVDVQKRISLRLTGGLTNDAASTADEHVGDSLEFLVAVVCANALARWRHGGGRVSARP